MALTYTDYQSFAEVEAAYNSIKPLGGSQNAGKDIRPIGDRRRKQERIVKVSRNCYALSDGWHYGEDNPYWERKATKRDMERYAPMVWRRHADGRETLTVRNGTGPGLHTMRYAFLHRHLPRGMTFINDNGKHFVATTYDKHYLAKGSTVPKEVYARYRASDDKTRWPVNRFLKYHTPKEDNVSLTFRRNALLRWEWVSGGVELPDRPKYLVDKDRKSALKPHTNAFREWFFAVAPMLPHDHKYQHDMAKEVREWVEANPVKDVNAWSCVSVWESKVHHKLAEAILTNEEHPLRVHLAVLCAKYIRKYSLSGDLLFEGAPSVYNRWVNKTLNLVNKVES